MRDIISITLLVLTVSCGTRNVDLNKTYSKQDIKEDITKSDSTRVVSEIKETSIDVESLDSFGLEILPNIPSVNEYYNTPPNDSKRKLTVTDNKGNTLTTTLNALDNVLFGSQSQNKLKLNLAQSKIDSLSVSNESLISKIKSLEKKKDKITKTKRPTFWLYILIAVASFFGGFYLARKV